mmetsp:Transcript_132578/g.369621  ORF Transcript_132578/g.369621 Transcript_132578/m.369621 type:complete len:268 (-) Transcript_132578:322-1125(-)
MCRCCSNRSCPPSGTWSITWPSASRRAARASGDSILSTLPCTRMSSKCSSRPELVLQTLTGGGLDTPSCRNSPSLHLVSFRMKSKTAKSFLLMVRSAWFTPLVVWYSCVSFQSSSWVRWWARSICTMLSVAFTFFRSRSAIWEPKRERSMVTCEKVSRFISVNSLHSITTASRSSQADSIMELRIFRAFWRESSLNSPRALPPPAVDAVLRVMRTSEDTSAGSLPSRRRTASPTSILSWATRMMLRSDMPWPKRSFMTIDPMDASRL